MTEISSSSTIAKRLLAARTEKGITQKQMAEALDMSLNTYISRETGERALDTEEIKKVQKIGIDVTWLLVGRAETSFQSQSQSSAPEALDSPYDSPPPPVSPGAVKAQSDRYKSVQGIVDEACAALAWTPSRGLVQCLYNIAFSDGVDAHDVIMLVDAIHTEVASEEGSDTQN